MDQIAFLKQHKEFSDAGDMAALAGLEEQALTHTHEFLNGEIAAEPETAPLFYSFFRTFSDTKNKDLKTACEKALEKVQPFLNQFDEENGLTRLDDLTKSVVEHNLAALSVYEQLNPFETTGKGLKFSEFEDLFRLTNEIDIIDSNGINNKQAHTDFVETLIDTAKLQTFLSQSLSDKKIDEQIYLSDLRRNMEKDLVLMFAADKIPVGEPIDDETKNKIEAEYQKLLETIR